jgi:hypothetical protein
MSDTDDPNESHALRLERLHSRQSILENQVKSSIDALRSSVDNMQLEARASNAKLTEFAGLHHANSANKAALDEMRAEMGRLGAKLDDWFQASHTTQDTRWREADAAHARWRELHEADNENTRIDLANGIKDMRDKVLVWSGIGFSVVLLGGVIVSAVVWGLNLRFEQQTAANTEAREIIRANRASIDKINDTQTEIQLYLARGGVNPQDPYKPGKP